MAASSCSPTSSARRASCLVQRRCDGAGGDAHERRDVGLGEVGDVVQHDGGPLALREVPQSPEQIDVVAAGSRRGVDPVRAVATQCLLLEVDPPHAAPHHIGGRAPDPSCAGVHAANAVPSLDGAHERLIESIGRQRNVAAPSGQRATHGRSQLRVPAVEVVHHQ